MKRNIEIHLLRGFVACAVVLIHVLNLALRNVYPTDPGYWFFKTPSLLMAFAVPCFIFISAILVTYTTNDNTFNPKEYFGKKFTKIVIPYILWSLIYLFILAIFGVVDSSELRSLESWAFWLGFGKAYTHLYFMSVIIQFYIVAPLLASLIRWINKSFGKYSLWVVLLVAFVPQYFIYWANRLYITHVFPYSATLFIWYWCIAILGLWIGTKYDDWINIVHKHRFKYIGIHLLSTLLYLTYQVYIIEGISINTFHYQITWYSYVLLSSIILLYMFYRLKSLAPKLHPLSTIAKYSFGIYLMHPIMTLILSKIIYISNPLVLVIVLIGSFIGIMLCCSFAVLFAQSFKWSSYFVGNYKPNNLLGLFSTYKEEWFKR